MSVRLQQLREEAERVGRTLVAEVVAHVDEQSARGFEALAAVKGDDRMTLDGAYGVSALELQERRNVLFLRGSWPIAFQHGGPMHEQADGATGGEHKTAEDFDALLSAEDRALAEAMQRVPPASWPHPKAPSDGVEARIAENMPIDPGLVDDHDPPPTQFENDALALRRRVKTVAAEVKSTIAVVRTGNHLPATLAGQAEQQREDRSEMLANLTIAYRHLEDASMRIGKAIQASNGGTSVYDRDSTVGA